MARKSYVGIEGDVAKQIKNLYIGVDNKARRVVKIYLGIGDIAQLIFDELQCLNHNFTDIIQTIAATCDTPKKVVKQCPSCKQSNTFEEGLALGHDQNKTIDAVPATCTSTGLTEGKKCSRCGKITVAQETTSKLNHKEVNGGSKDVHSKCSVCNTTIKNGKYHSYTASILKEATCREEGLEKLSCGCGYNFTLTRPQDPDNHTKDPVYGGIFTVHTKYPCCGKTISSTHTYDQDSGQVYNTATCSAKQRNFKSCICGYNPKNSDYLVEIGDLDPNNHYWKKSSTVAPTCTAKGYTNYYCQYNTSHRKKDDETDMIPHNYTIKGVTVSIATCQSPKRVSYYCEYNCGNSIVQEEGGKDPSNHTDLIFPLCKGCGQLVKQGGGYDINNSHLFAYDIGDYGGNELSIDVSRDYTESNYSTHANNIYSAIAQYSDFKNTTVTLIVPSTVTRIGNCAFYNLYDSTKILKKIGLPKTISYIGSKAFYGSRLQGIYYAGTKAEWKNISKASDWDENTTGIEVHCTDGSILLE